MSDIRDSLDEAWEDGGEDDSSTLAPASEVIEASDAPGSDEGDAGEDPTFDGEGAEPPARDASQRSETKAESEAGLAAKADSEARAAAGDAPIGWSPEAREGWGDVPEAARAQIAQRERQMEQVMANTQQARQNDATLGQLNQKYGAVMAAEGVQNPFQAIDGMFQTATRLRMGTPVERAQTIKGLITNYGVDIETLDSLLVGETPEARPNDQMAQMIDQRMQPVNQMMQQMAGMQQQKIQGQHDAATGEVHQFANNAEFLNDVRMDMADLMDLATKRGQSLSLEEAYNRACSVHPQISQVIQQRQQKESLLGKRQAAASISGSGQSGGTAKNLSLGDEVRSVWEQYS